MSPCLRADGVFNNLLPFCEADIGGVCPNYLSSGGGTSFATPMFAGILAIINQKVNGQQGQANYTLYKIATQQYSNSSQLEGCNASLIGGGSGCAFHDITEGNIRVSVLHYGLHGQWKWNAWHSDWMGCRARIRSRQRYRIDQCC